MEPASAGIMAGATLLSGLFGAAAQKERDKRQMLMEAQNQNFQAQMSGAQNLANNQQRAFETLMQGYKSALVR